MAKCQPFVEVVGVVMCCGRRVRVRVSRSCATEKTHMIFALRLRQLVVLELSSFVPFGAYFGSEYLGEPSPLEIILLVVELVLVEIQDISEGRLVVQNL